MSAAPSISAGKPGTSWLFLIVATTFLCVANGRWILPVAGWLAPAFLLIFIRSQPARIGLGIGFLAQLLAFSVNWQGMIPVPGLWYYVVAGTYAAVYFLPFVIHRSLAARHTAVRSTLLLPTAWVTLELIFQELSPYGSWASLGYTQVDSLPLLQLSSVTGLAGIHFFMLWSAAVVAGLWENRHRRACVLRLTGLWFGALLVVWLAGEARIRLAPRDVASLRVAGITPPARLTSELRRSMAKPAPAGSAPSNEASETADRINDDLLERTRAEARAGADVIVWSEYAAAVTPRTESGLVRRAQEIASRFGVTIVMGVGVWHAAEESGFENKAVMITSAGKVAGSYSKARPIVGSETSLLESGDSSPWILDTPRARLAVVICHDLDFPDFVRQAGRAGAVVLLAPSADWGEIASLHARMAIPRAVENGCSLVRPCEGGLSIAVDPLGRVLTAQPDRGYDGHVMVSEVPLVRMRALYPRVGDLFAYLTALGFFGLVVTGIRRRQPVGSGAPR